MHIYRKAAYILSVFWLSVCANALAESGRFTSDVIGVKEDHFSVSFWIDKLIEPEKELMDAEQIKEFNTQLINENPHVTNPLSVPRTLSREALSDKLMSISSRPGYPRFYLDGRELTDADYAKYEASLNREAIQESNTVEYALVVKRTALRKYPTKDRVLNSGMDADLDRFQETGVFPGDVAAVLHYSADNKWALIQVFHYIAWAPVEDLAVGEKAQIKRFLDAPERLVVTGAKVFTNYVPDNALVSEVQLDMGVSLPLMNASNFKGSIYGQNPYASYVVELPVRDEQGGLTFKPALIARHHDVHKGLLPLNEKNLLAQAFKFLGERYGWGHDYNGRDCTGFVGEIYRTFGLLMPRNSGDQGSTDYGINTRFKDASLHTEKTAALANMAVGDLIYIPGHVMMYIGDYQGEPYVIHAVKGLGYNNDQGQFYSGTLNGVSVTPLLPLRTSQETSYLDRIYNIKRLYGQQ
ncbi:glycoside hydrolase [Alteromonas sediminis]|uniref:Glycoside hydrolase n=1 Tax=Alteromonas sediminis TaxID=2259342 RepID=A0A3N5Y7B7_9ALTE|nr:NlpC/P60 family protein [Alteromonas sediminis]RPJ66649.1 glycoside hydrolase [Alteromonas sediminis]